MLAQATTQNQFINTITRGDCSQVMRQMPSNCVDFILTDPPYLVNYKDRTGGSIQNDSNSELLKPAMREAYRVLKQDRVAVMFYGWSAVDKFFAAWRQAGFYPVGHIVFRKDYPLRFKANVDLNSRFRSLDPERVRVLSPCHGWNARICALTRAFTQVMPWHLNRAPGY
jgi:DNA modification methylase